ncbi:sulfotransferase family protein [Rhizorhabdus histidinilytica]|uniref:Sulfotransferase family protein n=1 Tax=Rhizorhabdus histidinilytica TaxID=439228 RepID=A0A1T5DZR8_9SPHN|nr:sulfotransferase [Rhizorhabdus histidinilytica]SKB77298.1 Sulfotransferase family protein [Rhizorhabdus histidinilytica]
MPDIRIDDLAEPRLTDRQRAALAAAPPVTMTVEAVLDAARAATGLSDFGAEDFRERLAIWLASYEEDRDLAALGRATLFGECVRYASARLRIEDLWRRHPEIAAAEIDRPIMVAGLPRSGTTHLVNILAADPRLRSTPLWETMEPIPGPDDVGDPDPRRERTAAMWGAFEETLPLMPAMHEMAPDHVHEDIELQGPDFSSYLPEWLSRPARWRDHYLASDQTAHYAYAKRVMQALSWLKGPARWVVKSPPHMENLPALAAVHPTAIVPVTHRDPIAVLQSAITMIAYGDRIRRVRQDLPALAAWWIDRIEVLLRRCVRDRDAVPAARSIDILFHDYMADQKATVAKVYALADLEMTSEAEARIDHFLAANPRNKHGRVAYDLAGDFGVDVGAVRERFAFYYDRFPVRKEAVLGERL